MFVILSTHQIIYKKSCSNALERNGTRQELAGSTPVENLKELNEERQIFTLQIPIRNVPVHVNLISVPVNFSGYKELSERMYER